MLECGMVSRCIAKKLVDKSFVRQPGKIDRSDIHGCRMVIPEKESELMRMEKDNSYLKRNDDVWRS